MYISAVCVLSAPDTPPYTDYGSRDAIRPSGTKIVVIGLIVLIVLIFLTFIYRAYVRCYWLPRSLRRMTSVRHRRPTQGESTGGGLDKAILQTLPTFEFSEARLNNPCGKDTRIANECIVCLIGFVDDDICRLLPKCRHSFHAECVDKWFLSHTSCPMFRTPAEMIPAEDIKISSESIDALIVPHQEINGPRERSDSTAYEDNNLSVTITRTPRSLSAASVSIQENPTDDIRIKRSISLFSGQRDEVLQCLQKRLETFSYTFNGRSNTRNETLDEQMSERTRRSHTMKEGTHHHGGIATDTDVQSDICLGSHASQKTTPIHLPSYGDRSFSDRLATSSKSH
ncbi:hypothetical protein KP509_01G113600 [Ceratopteris richardii]|uniref:RING-type E3 ubiquitin transferase n=1 Tax=Ceratopteris richardii TaxID=49495 RepID=A0A8T2VT79_CERRI|nr:hypothetical protein KP509_01G113600 [Ceratopteris richardii]